MQDEISFTGVPALVAREQLADSVALTPSGDEPQLQQLAKVRTEKGSAGVDVQVPLDADRPAARAPSETARPQELPRAGLDVMPMAGFGFAMVIAGLALLRVAPGRAPWQTGLRAQAALAPDRSSSSM